MDVMRHGGEEKERKGLLIDWGWSGSVRGVERGDGDEDKGEEERERQAGGSSVDSGGMGRSAFF